MQIEDIMPIQRMTFYRKIRDAAELFSLRKSLGADYQAFIHEVTYINFIRVRTIGTLSFFIFAALTGLDAQLFVSGRWEVSPGYSLLFYSHCVVLALLGAVAFICWKYPLQRPGDARPYHYYLVSIALFLTLGCMAMISCADVLISGSIAAYLGTIFAISAIFLLPNGFSVFLFLTHMAFMIFLLVSVTPNQAGSMRIQIVNVAAFTLVAMFMSRILFYYHLKDFRNRGLIRIQRERLEELSRKDPLTQAANRRSFQDISRAEIARANRHRSSLSLVILDLDFFKSVNDTFGHCAGDTVLVEFSNIVRRNIREVDTFARWGGEEFLILSPQTSLQGMVQLAEKIRCVVEHHEFSHGSRVTASFGVTQYRAEEPWDDFIQRSDRALYMAKQKGRNRVEILS